MRTLTVDLLAGERLPFFIAGRHFQILEASSPLDVEFSGSNLLDPAASGVLAGYVAQPAEPFDSFALTSAVAQTVKLGISNGSGRFDRVGGSIDVQSLPVATGQLTVSAVAVTTASTLIVAANASRVRIAIRALLTNLDTVTLNNLNQAVTQGPVRLDPGQTWIDELAAPLGWWGRVLSGVDADVAITQWTR